MAIDGHAHREPPPLPSRAYLSAPRASPHPPSLTLELPCLPRRFSCTQLSSPLPPLKLGRRHRSPAPSSCPLLSLPPRLPRAVRKQTPVPFYFFPSCMPCHYSPATGRPPPLAPCRGRRPKRPARASARLSSQSRQLRLGVFRVRFSGRERRYGCCRRSRRHAPPLPTQAPPPSRVRAWMAVGSGMDDPDSFDPRVNPASNGQPGVLLLKRPPVS
jgi:hypothetical protein